MGVIYTAPAEHVCGVWLGEQPPVGSIWQCDECGQFWLRKTSSDGWGEYWDTISPRRVRRLLRRT